MRGGSSSAAVDDDAGEQRAGRGLGKEAPREGRLRVGEDRRQAPGSCLRRRATVATPAGVLSRIHFRRVRERQRKLTDSLSLLYASSSPELQLRLLVEEREKRGRGWFMR